MIDEDAESPLEYFQGKVECLVELGMSYTDAVMEFCEIENMEPEAVATMVNISGKIKARMAEEAEQVGILKKTSRLPL